MNDDLLGALVKGIDAALPEASSLRRAIHAEPHLSGDEQDTCASFTQATPWLDWHPIAETGAFARTAANGPAVGLRAELDALPILETTGVEWASQRRGIMHACGHDVHMAALWALLRAARDVDLPLAMVPLLQPREEIVPSGAADVVASGFLEDQGVRAMAAVHVQPQVERGMVSTASGAVNAAVDAFEIHVTGRGGHGAYPHVAIDPITTLAAIVTALGGVVGKVVNPVRAATLSVGTFHGGTAKNVIADEAACSGSIRAFTDGDRAAIHEAITRLAEGTAMARGAAATVTFQRGGPTLVNDSGLATLTAAALARAGVVQPSEAFRSCGSDDFAEYGQMVPSLMSFVGTGSADGIGLHHSRFLPGRDALRLAAVTLAASYVAACDTIG